MQERRDSINNKNKKVYKQNAELLEKICRNALQSVMKYKKPDEMGRLLCEDECKKTSKNQLRPKNTMDTETMDGKDVFEIRGERRS